MSRRRTFTVVLVLAALATAALAHADRAYAPSAPEPPRKATFWERVQSPHLDEIRRLVAEAVYLRQNVATQYWDQYLLPTRRQILRDALARYERALALDPRRADLRLDAGHCALEAGEWERAAFHYQAYREKSSDNAVLVAYNLAEAELRLGNFADAVDVLEPIAGDPSNYERARFLALLGQAYMARGRLDDAIDVLERAAAAYPSQYGTVDQLAVALLAVAYDRDEQLGRAHEMIDQLRAVDPQFYVLLQQQPITATQAPSQRSYLVYAPPADRHYFLGLFYEAQGRFGDAAASWRAYIDSAEPTFGRRAEQHLAAARRALEENARQRALAAKGAPTPAAASKSKKKGSPP